MKKLYLSFLKFLIGLISLYLASAFINRLGMVIYALSVLVIAIPVILNNAARYSLKKEIKLIEYEESKKLYKLFSGKTFGYTIIVITALVFAFIIPVRIYLFSSIEFLCLLIIFPLFLLSRYLSGKIVLAVYNNRFAPYRMESLTYIVTAFLSSMIFPLIAYALKDVNIHIPFLDNDIASLEYNYTAYLIGNFINFFDNVTNTILNTEIIKSAPFWFLAMLLVILSGGGLIFYGIISFISFFFIKKENLVKVFMPVKYYERNKINKFLASFIITLLVIFIYPSVFASITYISAAKQDMVRTTIEANTVAVEIINGVMYKAGTLRKIQLAADIAYGAAKDEMINEVNNMYDEILANTDKYLDWYYSLSAEYGRLLKVLAGSFEEYMTGKLKETLMDNVTLNIHSNIAEVNIAKLQNKINDILEENKIMENNVIYTVNESINNGDIYSLAEIEPLLDLEKRVLTSTGGGLIAGAVVTKIVGKVAAKTGFKTAAKAAVKTLAGKAVGSMAGIVTGVVSSVFTSPAGGIAIGSATGLAIEKGLLELEELVNKAEYKEVIITSIEENRQAMLETINKAFENK